MRRIEAFGVLTDCTLLVGIAISINHRWTEMVCCSLGASATMHKNGRRTGMHCIPLSTKIPVFAIRTNEKSPEKHPPPPRNARTL